MSDTNVLFVMVYVCLLECRGNYSATSNNTKLVHWPLTGGMLHLVQRGSVRADRSPPRTLLIVLDVTAHPSTAKQSKAKMCDGRRHVPLCPACANEK